MSEQPTPTREAAAGRPWWLAAEGAIVVLAMALTVVKATRMSFGYDEALCWQLYWSRGLHAIFTHFDANNHMLNTLLGHACGLIYGPWEISYRLPALAGRALFLASVWVLVRRMFDLPVWRFAALAGVALHPYLLDWGSAARGYSLALGYLAAGMVCCHRVLTAGEQTSARSVRRWLLGQSLFTGAAAASVPTFVHPAIPMAALVCWRVWQSPQLVLGSSGAAHGAKWKAAGLAVVLLGAMAVPLNVALYTPLLLHADTTALYAGKDTFRESWVYHFTTLFHYAEINFLPVGDALVTAWKNFLLTDAAVWMSIVAAVLLAAAGIAASRSAAMLLVMGALAGSVALSAAERLLLGVPWPLARTGVYHHFFVLMMVPLVGQAVAQNARSKAGDRAIVYTSAAAAAIWLLVLTMNLNLRFHQTFRLSPPVRETVMLLRHDNPGERPILLVYSDLIRPEFPYYRGAYGLEWLELRLLSDEDTTDERADYYFYFDFDENRPTNVTVIRRFPDQFAQLAAPAEKSAP